MDDDAMFNFFYTISDFSIFLLLSSILIFLSISIVFALKRLTGIRFLHRDNTAIGSIDSLLGVIYGVLAGLIALYLINNNSYTTEIVQREASALANIYRESTLLNDPLRTELKAQVVNYLNEVIKVEWPAMKQGKSIDDTGDVYIHKMSHAIYNQTLSGSKEVFMQQDLLREIKSLYNAREQRILMSKTSLSIEIWLVILIGSILTIAINFIFRMSFGMHIITICGVGLMMASMLFLLVTLDRPFQGQFSIEPLGFLKLQRSIQHDTYALKPSNYLSSA